MREKFFSEDLAPRGDEFDTAAMAAGGPGLPREFLWRGETLRVAKVVRTWRETGPCRHGSGERYARKHWFEVRDDQGRVLTIYFDRQPRGRQFKARWRLYSMMDSPAGPTDAAGENT